METRRLVNLTRRTFLKSSPNLTACSFHLLLNEFDTIKKTESNLPIKKVYLRSRLMVFLGRHVIVIHDNDLVTPLEGIEDFEKKLTIISELTGRAITALPEYISKRTRFVEKRFLNDHEGISDLYTSTFAITMTETHGVTFELGSCDVKSRITLGGKTAQLKFLTKFKEFIDLCVADVSKAKLNFIQELEQDVKNRLL